MSENTMKELKRFADYYRQEAYKDKMALCPICGRVPHLNDNGSVLCFDSRHRCFADTIEEWNQRPGEDQLRETIEVLSGILSGHDKGLRLLYAAITEADRKLKARNE